MSTIKRVTSICAGAMVASTLSFNAFAVELRVMTEEIFTNPPTLAVQVGLEYIQDQLPKVTNGEVTAKLINGTALGTEKTMIKQLPKGVVDMLVVSAGNIGSHVPEIRMMGTSYLFNSYDHVRRVLSDDKIFQLMKDKVAGRKLGFQLAGIGLTGTRNFYNRLNPVTTMEGLKGMKMRVMSSPVEFTVWSALGTLPITMSAKEIYTSMQTGVIDAAESSIPAIVANRYYEIAPNITLTRHQFNTAWYLLSDLAIEKIPAEHMDAVLKVFRDAGNIQVDAAETLSATSLEFLKSRPGVTVSEIDTRPMAKILYDIQNEVAKELGMEDLLTTVRERAGG